MTVLIDDVVDGVRTLRMNRPQAKNALTASLLDGLAAALRDTATRSDVRAVVLTGEGGSFCSGVDLKVAMMGGDDAIQGTGEERVERFHVVIRALRACPQPVVGLVDGAAVGFGCDLALACDLRVATSRAYFQEKFVAIGLVPDGGGSWQLPRLVGLARAAELLMLGDRLEADEALRLGVVNRVVPPEEGTAAARALAERLAKGPPQALARIKRLLSGATTGTLDQALAAEKAAQVECLGSPEMVEGVSAFFEKRAAKF